VITNDGITFTSSKDFAKIALSNQANANNPEVRIKNTNI
jgi:hypothetical protein